MGFDFSKQKPKKKDEPELTEEQKGFRERDKREKDRILEECDTEFWLCVCFSTQDKLKAFQDDIGVSDKYIDGETFRKATEKFKPETHKRQFTHVTEYPADKHFFDDLPFIGDYEVDTRLQILKMGAEFENIQAKDEYKDPTEGVWWCAVYFKDRDDKGRYLDEMELKWLGDKYIDGDKWMEKV